jgi:hypothetical protein
MMEQVSVEIGTETTRAIPVVVIGAFGDGWVWWVE